MKKIVLTFSMMLLTVAFAMADVTAKGNVIDAETNEPMIGANVIVKGSTTGTITDLDGSFELVVPDNAVLEFSYVGYKTVEKTAGASMKIALESDATMLTEVVSLGYSAVKKAELSSAVVTISGDKLTDVTTSDVGTMLQGKVAGVQVSNSTGAPGSQAEIKIRGTGSITASSSPVYVVDGVMGGSFNPNDVETISVLKDAGSTGIYGAAAAGGVIVVTTKQGKKDSKPMVNLRVSAGGDQPLFGRYKTMNGKELYYFQKSYFTPASTFREEHPASLMLQNYNWLDEYFKTGITQDYSVSISGGSQKVGYYVSFNYYKQDGTLKNTDYERFSGRANVNAQIAKWLDMSVRVNFDKDKRNNIYSWRVLDDAYNKMPWDNPRDVNTGDYLFIVPSDLGVRPDNGKKWYSQDSYNTLNAMQKNYNRDNGFSMGSDVQLAIHFTDWLTLQSTVRYSHGDYKNVEFIDPATADKDYPDGYLGNTIGISNSIGTTTILKGGYQWGSHSFNAMLGHEWGKWNTEYSGAAGTGMPTGVQSLNACTMYSIMGYNVPGESWAAFAQASYDYAKRYFVTATFRAEASSIFAPQNRVGYFPSVAASWLITNERWMEPYRHILNMFKFRASYGVTGNNNIPEYQYLSTVSLAGVEYQNIKGAQFARLSNPELHWETANMAAIGFDLGFINRIDMSLDLYNTDNTGLLLDVPVAPSTGFFKVMKNAGSVRNQGIEYSINATAIQTKDWRWDLGFNIGFNKNRVTSLPGEPFLQTQNSINQRVEVGHDLYSWYIKEWAGVNPDNGDPLWYMVDEKGNYVLDAQGNKTVTNKYAETHETWVGTATPLFQGGLNTMLSWRGLSLNINTFFNYGNKVYNYNRETIDSDGAYLTRNALSLDNGLGWTRWEKPGDVATHPKAAMEGNQDAHKPSSRYLEDGSYFRLKNITLSYDFATLIPKGYVNKLRLYVSADNVATATKYSGMDPECSITTAGGSLAGYNADQYPICRTIMGGLEIQF